MTQQFQILYSQLPLRVVNGQTLNAPLTIASPRAVYIKGNFNSIAPKPSSMVTGNRTYHLSGIFKDYSGFFTPAPMTTLVDTIAGHPIATSTNYATFTSLYGDPAGENRRGRSALCAAPGRRLHQPHGSRLDVFGCWGHASRSAGNRHVRPIKTQPCLQ